MKAIYDKKLSDIEEKYWTYTNTKNILDKAILNNKKNCCRYHHPWSQALLCSHSNKNSIFWPLNQHAAHLNQFEDSDINPYMYRHLILDMEARSLQ